MTTGPIVLPDCWGVDTIAVFNAASAMRMLAATFQGHPLLVFGRYIEDMQASEVGSITAAGGIVVFYSHVARPGWLASASMGKMRGQAIADKLQRLQIAGVSVVIDMEGVGNPGPAAMDYVRGCAAPIASAGSHAAMYEGYDDGLQLSERVQLVTEGTIVGIDADFGPRVPPPGIGFLGKQFSETTLAGILVDPHHYFPDQRGVALVGWGLQKSAPTDPPEDTEPHTDPTPMPNVDPVAA